jgi:hypothetical protein
MITVKMSEDEMRVALAHWCGSTPERVRIDAVEACDGVAGAEIDTTLEAMNAADKKRRTRKPKAEGEG